MSRQTIFGLAAVLVVIALVMYGYKTYQPMPSPSSSVYSDANEAAIRAEVEEYGTTLAGQNKINIVSVVPRASGAAFQSYQVEANIVQYVSAPNGGTQPHGVQPVSLTVEKQNDGSWVVTNVSKGVYSEVPQQVVVTGLWECLPHKDRTGPQTMECAFGMAIDQSDGHYAIDTSLMSEYPVDFAVGTHIRVQGVRVPANQLSSVQKYDIDGVIQATSITKI